MKIGFALAGGGIRGAAHLGIIQALEEQGIKAVFFAGTSAGSIVATLKALDYSNEKIFNILKNVNTGLIDIAYWDILKAIPSKFAKLDSLLKGKRLQKFLDDSIQERFLLHTIYPLGIVATDINTGKEIVFSSVPITDTSLIEDDVVIVEPSTSLPLSKMMYASAALPGVFRPYLFREYKLVDGSLVNNLPANVLKAMGVDKIVAIDLSASNRGDSVTGLMKIIGQSVSILVEQNSDLSLAYAKDYIYLNPKISDISILDFDKAFKCYERGYEYGKTIIDDVQDWLEHE